MDSSNNEWKLKRPTLTDEQVLFIEAALSGENILVDACYGSGKTTAIQRLCDAYPRNSKITYLTYNKLLKTEAQKKIRNPNVFVTNYHGYALRFLQKKGINVSVSDTIQEFIKVCPKIDRIQVLVLDEYQDIDQEISDMLLEIKRQQPGMQIVAVGDMAQKIYNKTKLDAGTFINTFLDEHQLMKFTKCFRSSKEYASRMGRIWNKDIIGENAKSKINIMTFDEAKAFVSSKKTKDVLCLGNRTGDMSVFLNELESGFPELYNKKTVFASIRDKEGGMQAVEPKKDSAIFTTYDSSKGLERKYCLVFDYTTSNWESRSNQPDADYRILRNVFCVAATRGKKETIFVLPRNGNARLLTEMDLKTDHTKEHFLLNYNISEMFNFKYRENIEEAFRLLTINEVSMEDHEIIYAKVTDDLIDLSPCIGTYQEAIYFSEFDIDKKIQRYFQDSEKRSAWQAAARDKAISTNDKILLATAIETNQRRYIDQVHEPLASSEINDELKKRLSQKLKKSERVQVECSIKLMGNHGGNTPISLNGVADVVKEDSVWELKFVSDLSHENFLQCACYVIALRMKKGVLWNTRDNRMFEISVPNENAFLQVVAKTISKEVLTNIKRV